MKEIVVLSGKGGTGKTSITAALASLYDSVVLADCDVDGADLFLLTDPSVRETYSDITAKEAVIDNVKCIDCGKCFKLCVFGAVKKKYDTYSVDGVFCEGCGVCAEFCPEGAISMKEVSCGERYLSDTRFGFMTHARLKPGAENSGKVVTAVREQAKKVAKENNLKYILVDGPPGIGCPVIASVTGADEVLVITEPTLSGIHDLKRTIKLTKHFKVKTSVCVNRADINKKFSGEIKKISVSSGCSFLGAVPFSKEFVDAQINKKTITEFAPKGKAAKVVEKIWQELK